MIILHKNLNAARKALCTFLIVGMLGSFSSVLAQGCGCTNCPQFMPDNFVGDFLISVTGADNPTLGQNGQGVCGVTMHLDHEYIGDLTITLTSPSGQSVTLIGPEGFFGSTDGTSWDISFVPCNDPANPDPGFSANWNNNQNWGENNSYFGSYFPNQGCLENFNSGPVDGTWTLTVVDGQAIDVGNFYDYEIIFCDPSGIFCFTCAAEAGNLTQPNITSCQGSANLDLNLPPTYTPPLVAPPSGEYSYTYIVSGTGGVILAYEPGPDLTAYDPGTYTVCGLSYLTAQEGDIPAPNGILTTTQLNNQLESGMPPFCGSITGNCVNVTINSAPPDEEEFAEICAPGCYLFHGLTYCQSGTYVRNLTTPQGCPYTATLNLTVHQPNQQTLVEFICEGECATTPGFEDRCFPGNYQELFQNEFGCDSLVTLNLQVLVVNAAAAPTGQLDCNNPSVQITGAGSTTGANVSYLWTASNGGHIVGTNTNINVLVDAPGDYTLRVCRTGGGVSCCDSISVNIDDDGSLPAAPAGIAGPSSLCQGDTATYSASSVPEATSYVWTVPPGVTILGNASGNTLQVIWDANSGGQICVASSNDCGTSPSFCLDVQLNSAPNQPMVVGNPQACPDGNGVYSVSNVPSASNYVWTVTNGSITAGQGTDSVQVSWNANAMSGMVCAQAENSCGSSPSNCFNVNLSIPAAGQIDHQCDSTNSNYTMSFPISGGTAPYAVVGGNIINGVFISDPIPSGQSYSFQISDTNACLSTVITGQFNCACATDAGNMDLNLLSACEDQSVSAIYLGGQTLDGNDVTGFMLHSGSGTALVPPIFDQNTTGVFSYQPGMVYGQTYYVSAVAGNDLNGFPDLQDQCLSVAQGQPVVFYQNPVANAGIDQDTCGLSLLLSGNAGVGLGSWALLNYPLGDTLLLGNAQNPNSLAIASDFGEYQLVWTLDNNGCVDADTLALSFFATPNLTAVDYSCDSANENYTLSFQISGGTPNFTWTGMPAGVLSGNSFVSNPILNGGTYSYQISDSAGCVSVPLTGAFSCNCATNAGNMSQTLLSACEGGSVAAQHLGGETLDGNDTVSYVLHTLSGNVLGQIIAQNSSGVFDFQSGMSYDTVYYVSFVVGNNLGGIPNAGDPCFAVAPGQPVVFYQNPVASAGADLNTCGTTLNLNGNAPAGSSGQWSVTNAPSGGSLNIANAGNPSSVVVASGFGLFTLSWTLTQNGCVGNDEVELQFNESPILDSLERDCDAANENFTVTLTISGGAQPYTVNGQAIAGNSFISNSFGNGQSYTFSVTDANGCSMPNVSGAFSCNCATNAGTMFSQALSACEGADLTATAAGDFNLDGNDVTAFVLHTGAGPALGQAIAQNASGTFSFDPAQMQFGTTYYISLVAGNPSGTFPDPLDPCFSVAPGQPVAWLQNPVPQAGQDLATCGNIINLNAVDGLFSGTWSLVSGPGTVIFDNENDPASMAEVSANGIYIFRWTETNGTCVGVDDMSVDFNAIPDVITLDETCNGTNTEYIVAFDASNGVGPYSVSGLTGTFSGNTFTSLPLPNNSSYSFVLVDANGCESPSISGAHNCACGTDAGSMETNPATFCGDTPATAVWNNDATTDADDIVQFVLHNGSAAILGSTIYAVNDQPNFSFGGNLQYGVVYYISAVAGNNLSGNVDLDDPCLSVTPGTPVRWKALPTAEISGDITLCEGSSAILAFSGSGTYPLTVDYSDGTTLSSLILAGPQTVTLTVTPQLTTSYSLINVTDGTLPNCAMPLADAVTIVVNQPVDAGTANAPRTFCAGEGQLVQLASLLTGADAGGQWSETSATPSQNTAFNPANGTFQANGQSAGTYTFRYLLTALSPCPDAETSVSVIIHPKPNADAGADKTLNCNNLTANLGGTGTSSGSYHWLLNGDTIGIERELLAKEGGLYTLWVTTNEGCTDSDVVQVLEDNEVPMAEITSVRNIRCFGERNGAVSVESVNSSYPPVLYALNGGTFVSNPIFEGLPPGDYVITLQDAHGCESETAILTVNEPPELVASLGADLELQLADSAHVQLQTSIPVDALQNIQWQPLLDSTAAGKPYQNFFPLQSWQIGVTITDSSGCVAEDRIIVRVEKPRNIFIPNIFKPAGDFAPVLHPFGGRDVEEVELFQIYDRWGEEIFVQRNFQPNDPSLGWDGRAKGEMVNPAVFVYWAVVRFIDGERVTFKGDVTVIR